MTSLKDCADGAGDSDRDADGDGDGLGDFPERLLMALGKGMVMVMASG